jgi:hypothetical protein
VEYVKESTAKRIRQLENGRNRRRERIAAMSEEEYRAHLDAESKGKRRNCEQRINIRTVIRRSSSKWWVVGRI